MSVKAVRRSSEVVPSPVITWSDTVQMTRALLPLRAAFIAAQAALTALLQGIPTGRQDKPYLLLSLALALAGLLSPLSAMICGVLR